MCASQRTAAQRDGGVEWQLPSGLADWRRTALKEEQAGGKEERKVQYNRVLPMFALFTSSDAIALLCTITANCPCTYRLRKRMLRRRTA
jgi:hypothetical protein